MHNMKMKCHKYVLHMLVCAKLTSAHPLSALLLSRSLLEDASGLACGTSASEAVAGMGGVAPGRSSGRDGSTSPCWEAGRSGRNRALEDVTDGLLTKVSSRTSPAPACVARMPRHCTYVLTHTRTAPQRSEMHACARIQPCACCSLTLLFHMRIGCGMCH